MNLAKLIDERILRKLNGYRLAFRGVVTLVQAAGKMQVVQGKGLDGEPLEGMEYFQHWGLASNPPDGSMFITLPLGGKTVHCVVIASEHADKRLQGVQRGESALYNDQAMKVHLTKTGIVIDGGGKPIKLQNFSEVEFLNAAGTAPYQFVHTGSPCPLGGNHIMGSLKIKGGD